MGMVMKLKFDSKKLVECYKDYFGIQPISIVCFGSRARGDAKVP